MAKYDIRTQWVSWQAVALHCRIGHDVITNYCAPLGRTFSTGEIRIEFASFEHSLPARPDLRGVGRKGEFLGMNEYEDSYGEPFAAGHSSLS